MLLCPAESTNRSRPAQSGLPGLCRIAFWKSVYAIGARLIAVPGWPLPTFWTASIASTRAVSTARLSRSVQSSLLTGGFLPAAYDERQAFSWDSATSVAGQTHAATLLAAGERSHTVSPRPEP